MAKAPSSLKVDRFNHIMKLVNASGRVSLSELERQLTASRITIQRDLVELEHRNMLKRFHGGAMSLTFSGKLYNLEQKIGENVAAKKKIAARASGLIRAGDYTAMDPSSTVQYLTETVFPGNGLVFCCGVDAFRALSRRDDLQLVLAGGRFDRSTGLVNGLEAVEAIKRFRFDTVFLSCETCAGESGFFDPFKEEVLVKKALMAQAKKVVFLLDSSKFRVAGGIRVCLPDEVDTVITEADIPAEFRKPLKGKLICAGGQ